MKLTRSNIWNCKQNKPTQVVQDITALANKEAHTLWDGDVYEVLLRRGVFKWLAVRRELIWLKNYWKDRLKNADHEFKQAKLDGSIYHTAYMKGYRKALVQCRQEVRALCHGERWQAPDNDREAQRWLADYGAGEMEKVEGK